MRLKGIKPSTMGSAARALSFRAALAIALATIFLGGCAYYNYFYNARKYFEQAEKTRREASVEKGKKGVAAAYDRSIESAARMLQYYPDSKWEDDALLLIAKAYYRAGKFRNSITKVDELTAKYPESPFVEEGSLYKALSLLNVAQEDSGRAMLGQLAAGASSRKLVGEAYFGLGDYYYSDKRWDLAFDQYQEASKAAAEDKWLRGEAWVKMGICLAAMERYSDAVKLYGEILAQDIPRRQRFEAELQRAASLRRSGRSDEGGRICKELLKDGAFADDFPRVELEAARCEIASGGAERARERLEVLVEQERRGETGAQAQYELGLLLWSQWRDYEGSANALRAVKTTEKSASVAPAADSLLSEVETLAKLWMKLRFLQRQREIAASARRLERPLTRNDTLWIDSLAAKPKELPKDKPRRGMLKGDPNDPIRKMVEAAMTADSLAIDFSKADSAKTAPDTAAVAFDSLQIERYDSLRFAEWRDVIFGLSEFHLFERKSLDSARFYIEMLLSGGPTGDIGLKAAAILAFIYDSKGDTTASDSIYHSILAANPPEVWRSAAERALGIPPGPPARTAAQALVDSAEGEWRAKGDAESARLIYLLAAEVADSGDTAAARGLYAAAFITRAVLKQDSLGKELYAQVVERFPGTTYAKAAAKFAVKRKKEAAKGAAVKDDPADRLPLDGMDDVSLMPDDSLIVYDAKDVDEPPRMITLPDILESYLRSYYPFEAFPEQLRGVVEIELIVSASGEKRDVNVASARPEGFGFDEAALSVLNSIEYRPGRRSGKPVDVKFKQILTFKPPEHR